MNNPSHEQKLVTIPVLCQILVEFIEDTDEGGNSVYKRELKRHAKAIVESSDKFLAAVYSYAKTQDYAIILAEEQNNIALALKNSIANGVQIETEFK